jgi:hypothetical protein
MYNGFKINNSILVTTFTVALTLTAYDRTSVVVNAVAETIEVPGPAGKAGEQSVDDNKANMGDKANTGIHGINGTRSETGQAGETPQSLSHCHLRNLILQTNSIHLLL